MNKTLQYQTFPIASIDDNDNVIRCGMLGIFQKAKVVRQFLPDDMNIDDDRIIGETCCEIFSSSWNGTDRYRCSNSEQIAGKSVYSITWKSEKTRESVIKLPSDGLQNYESLHLNRKIGTIVAAVPTENFVFILLDEDFPLYEFDSKKVHKPSPPDHLKTANIQPFYKMTSQGDRYYKYPRDQDCANWLKEQKDVKPEADKNEEVQASIIGYSMGMFRQQATAKTSTHAKPESDQNEEVHDKNESDAYPMGMFRRNLNRNISHE